MVCDGGKEAVSCLDWLCELRRAERVSVFIEPGKPFVRNWLLQKVAAEEQVGTVQRALSKILSECAGIHLADWEADEEFKTPGGRS